MTKSKVYLVWFESGRDLIMLFYDVSKVVYSDWLLNCDYLSKCFCTNLYICKCSTELKKNSCEIM